MPACDTRRLIQSRISLESKWIDWEQEISLLRFDLLHRTRAGTFDYHISMYVCQTWCSAVSEAMWKSFKKREARENSLASGTWLIETERVYENKNSFKYSIIGEKVFHSRIENLGSFERRPDLKTCFLEFNFRSSIIKLRPSLTIIRLSATKNFAIQLASLSQVSHPVESVLQIWFVETLWMPSVCRRFECHPSDEAEMIWDGNARRFGMARREDQTDFVGTESGDRNRQ